MLSKLIAATIMIILMPIFFLIGIMLLVSDGFPILFKQKRLGRNCIEFTMYKFRTMKNDAPNDVATRFLKDPKKYNTIFGSILRKYSLDELPQLINIIKGDMRFIGPRPCINTEEDLINLREKYRTFQSIPGVTGWAQVNGRDSISMEDKAKMEGFYMENKSLLLDIKILLMTVKHVFLASGIYPDKLKHFD
tara:strand:+ start:9164 stop:9739 length:576 start_codon:yes stop_codon:yes gene_type:complete